MTRLLSGRVKTRFNDLPADNDEFLAEWGAEPYLGVPPDDNSIVFLDSDGTRRFALPPVFLPGNEIQAQSTDVDAEIYHVFVDAIGTNSQFLADTGVRYNPFLDTMYIDQNLVVGNDVSVGNNVSVTGTVTTTSDERVKDNIQEFPKETSALDLVKQITGYSYNRTDLEGNPKQYGVIAQEIQRILPDFVQEDGEGKLSVSYNFFIPLLLEAIKELEERVCQLS